ncbi:hypothetical protein [Conexibacter sp. SYSU D00693]|uniref:hypothetical protein n=1 Tax=Conexibacter sp. SYSU D00693 TaxID=2812560 RepID=UPI00196AC3D2|nr:hypothetical protein [Conexibacter sp. SYSU D00693]
MLLDRVDTAGAAVWRDAPTRTTTPPGHSRFPPNPNKPELVAAAIGAPHGGSLQEVQQRCLDILELRDAERAVAKRAALDRDLARQRASLDVRA